MFTPNASHRIASRSVASRQNQICLIDGSVDARQRVATPRDAMRSVWTGLSHWESCYKLSSIIWYRLSHVTLLLLLIVSSGAVVSIGELLTCEATQLQAKAAHVKSSQCLGSDVSTWEPSDMITIGVIIGSFFATVSNYLFNRCNHICLTTSFSERGH